MRVLLVDPPEHGLPSGTADVLSDIGLNVTVTTDYAQAVVVARREWVEAVVMVLPDGVAQVSHESSTGAEGAHGEITQFLRFIHARRIAAIMLGDRRHGAGFEPVVHGPDSLVDVVDRDVSLAELRGRLATIERYQRRLRHLERELEHMERLGKRLNRHFQEVEQEMRLAGRLQRDFLPKLTKPIRNARFASIYRPASWVSGDMFDVFRIDEDHTGFYLADAVGHGMAASLLTMFIKRAIVSKRIEGEHYTVLTPSETISALNDALAAQALPSCQFVTACYAILNHSTLELQHARGGHPYPLLVTPGGSVSRLESGGGLLGLVQGDDFPTRSTRLTRGDKLILYTDGLELALEEEPANPFEERACHALFGSLAALPIQEVMERLNTRLDASGGSLAPGDDVTILGLEILDD